MKPDPKIAEASLDLAERLLAAMSDEVAQLRSVDRFVVGGRALFVVETVTTCARKLGVLP